MKRFEAGTTIISGHGAVSALKELGGQRVFIVTDPFFFENGTAANIAALSGAAACGYFSEVKPDPTVELVAQGTAVLREFQPDLLIALGGGSAMDCAKAMAYFSGTQAKFVAIPTTSGSGSEVTDFAVLTHDGVKYPLIDQRLRPAVAILDSSLLENLPKGLIADTGFDVISHALEALVATNGGMITDALAREAFRTVYSLLTASFAGDKQARLPIHTAATMAGMAFNQAGLGLCHGMAHSLGGVFHIPHGRLNAILLPAVIERNACAAGAKYAKLASEVGITGGAQTIGVRNLKNALMRLRGQLNMPATLQQAGIDPLLVRKETPALVEAILKDPCCDTNPVRVDAGMIRGILEEVTGRV